MIRPLTAADEPAFTSFTCANYREPWTVPVQDMIRYHLAEALARHAVDGIGVWEDETLCGVAAWRIERDVCHSAVLVVGVRHRHQGIAKILKQTVIDHARAAGVVAVVSRVHWDNEAMINLNVAMGANVERIPRDPDYCRCVIAVRPCPPATQLGPTQ